VIDVSAELATRRGDRFEDYTEAVRALAGDDRFPADLIRQLERLPGFRNVFVHEYVSLDMTRVMEALDELAPIDRFAEIVRQIEAGTDAQPWRRVMGLAAIKEHGGHRCPSSPTD